MSSTQEAIETIGGLSKLQSTLHDPATTSIVSTKGDIAGSTESESLQSRHSTLDDSPSTGRSRSAALPGTGTNHIFTAPSTPTTSGADGFGISMSTRSTNSSQGRLNGSLEFLGRHGVQQPYPPTPHRHFLWTPTEALVTNLPNLSHPQEISARYSSASSKSSVRSRDQTGNPFWVEARERNPNLTSFDWPVPWYQELPTSLYNMSDMSFRTSLNQYDNNYISPPRKFSGCVPALFDISSPGGYYE